MVRISQALICTTNIGETDRDTNAAAYQVDQYATIAANTQSTWLTKLIQPGRPGSTAIALPVDGARSISCCLSRVF